MVKRLLYVGYNNMLQQSYWCTSQSCHLLKLHEAASSRLVPKKLCISGVADNGVWRLPTAHHPLVARRHDTDDPSHWQRGHLRGELVRIDPPAVGTNHEHPHATPIKVIVREWNLSDIKVWFD